MYNQMHSFSCKADLRDLWDILNTAIYINGVVSFTVGSIQIVVNLSAAWNPDLVLKDSIAGIYIVRKNTPTLWTCFQLQFAD